jgi:hypothetical protein
MSVFFASNRANAPLVEQVKPASRLAGHPDNVVRPRWWHPSGDASDLQDISDKSDNSTLADRELPGYTDPAMDDRGTPAGSVIEARETTERAFDDTRLGRLQARLEMRLRNIELPEGGFTSPAQAKAAARLEKTFIDLVKVEAELNLPPREKPERLCEAVRLRGVYVKHHTKTGELIPSRPRGRPRRIRAETVSLPA